MSFIGNFLGSMAYQYHSKGDLVKAEDYYRRALKKGDQTAMHFLTFGILLLQKGEFEDGVEVLTLGLKVPVDERTKASIRCNRALGYQRLGQEAKALAALEDLHKNYPCAQVYEVLGYVYIKTGKLEKAVEYGLEGLEYDEKNVIIMDNLAQVYILLEKWDEAQAMLDRAFAIREKQADLLYHQALCDLHRGDRTAALEHLRLAKTCNMNALNDVTPEMLEKLEREIEA